MKYTTVDYLWGNCSIEERTTDVTANLGADVPGQVLLIPYTLIVVNKVPHTYNPVEVREQVEQTQYIQIYPL